MALTFGVAGAVAHVPGEKRKPPQKGDTVVVKGCLRGAILEATETARVDDTDSLVTTPYMFQLKGKKDLLKKLRGEHDDQLVELTGKLQSALDVPVTKETQVGRTRIVVGGGTSTTFPPVPGTDQIMPVLEVKSYESAGVSCRR
ncbi:MAG TPA: hypothetical protein VLD67_17190 [Vicinamibacterales bacterium]|nr:hypothetical protein [Vicinamibacterales bacterium]